MQSRLPLPEVYTAIKKDLADATSLLPEIYTNNSGDPGLERVRPNRFAAKAMTIRILMLENKWQEVERLASEIINSREVYNLVEDLKKVFLKNSTEAIWQIMSVLPQNNSSVGAQMILVATPQIFATDTLFYYDFSPNDLRKSAWMNFITLAGKKFYFPYKYKVGQNASSITEYTMMLRLSEVILNRAESSARLGKIEQSLLDLNKIRSRAGLPAFTVQVQSAILDAIIEERRFELFSESGHRWIDLNRLSIADKIMIKKKNSNWESTDVLYPIPQIERDKNPTLSQNSGY